MKNDHQATQFSIRRPSIPPNSWALFVTRVPPCSRTIAAIKRSWGPMIWPVDSAAYLICA